MRNLILRVWDFDKTITIKHSYKEPHKFQPATNTKKNLGFLKHDRENILAIATYHDDADYVLSYLLPLLGLTKKDISNQTTKEFEHHKLTLITLRNNPIPIIISTLHKDNHDFHVQESEDIGKNDQIEAILEELPFCKAYHYFDDTRKYLDKAEKKFKQFFYHHVEPDNEEFSARQIAEPLGGAYLKNLLCYYKQEREQDKRGDYFSLLTLFGIKGYLKTDKFKAIDALYNTLTKGIKFDRILLDPLHQGRLGHEISLWEQQTGLRLEDYITQLEADQYDEAPLISEEDFFATDYNSDEEDTSNNPRGFYS